MTLEGQTRYLSLTSMQQLKDIFLDLQIKKIHLDIGVMVDERCKIYEFENRVRVDISGFS